MAYTYVTRPPLVGSCCFKSSVPAAVPRDTCTSGVRNPSGPPTGSATAPLPLLPGDGTIDIRVLVDGTFAEVFVMGGRLAFTIDVNAGAIATTAGVALSAAASNSVALDLEDVAVWHMGSIWTSPSEVLALRADRGE